MICISYHRIIAVCIYQGTISPAFLGGRLDTHYSLYWRTSPTVPSPVGSLATCPHARVLLSGCGVYRLVFLGMANREIIWYDL